LRGSEGWLDNDAAPQVTRAYSATRVHAATVAGTRAGGGRPNQDAFGCSPSVGPAEAPLLLAAVYDGHGPQGHFISRHVRDRLPAWITSCCAEDCVEAAAPGLAAMPEEEDAMPGAQPVGVRLAVGSAAYELAHARAASPSGPPPARRRCPGGLLPSGTPAWVAPAARRHGLAIRLLDLAAQRLRHAAPLPRAQLAFSQPTAAGRALAERYSGCPAFLVYSDADLGLRAERG
jgi:hypothetical protein